MNNKFKFHSDVIGVQGYKLDLENIKLIKTINTNYHLKNYKSQLNTAIKTLTNNGFIIDYI